MGILVTSGLAPRVVSRDRKMRDGIVLGHSDVILMSDDRRITSRTTRTCEVMGEVLRRLRVTGGNYKVVNDKEEFAEWVVNGIACEIMAPTTNGWVNGKVRICLEFMPDEEEEISPSIAMIEASPMPTDAVFGGNSSEIQ